MHAVLIFLAVASGLTMLVALSWPTARKYRRLMRRSFRPRYRKTKALHGEVEREIHQALRDMVGPALDVFPRVRLYDLLELSGGSEERNEELARRVRGTSVDFVICDATTAKPMLVVALRNASKQDTEAQEHNRFIERTLDAAGLPLLPISRQSPTSGLQLAETVQQSLSTYIRKTSHAA